MTEIRATQKLWSAATPQEGMWVKGFATGGAGIGGGARIAEIGIEDALHDITAPGHGRRRSGKGTSA